MNRIEVPTVRRAAARSRSSTSASTVASRPVVGSSRISSVGIVRQRHGDRHALLHAAGELVRIALHDAGADRRSAPASAWRRARSQRLGCRYAAELEDLGHLPADAERRVQRAAGILIDHRDAVGAQPPQRARRRASATSRPSTEIAPAAHAAVARQIAHDGQRGGRFAAAGFADQPVGLAAADAEAEVAQHLAVAPAHAVGDVEVVEGRARSAAWLGGRASAASSLERSLDAVGDEIDADHQRGDGERRRTAPSTSSRRRSGVVLGDRRGPSRARAAGCRSR